MLVPCWRYSATTRPWHPPNRQSPLPHRTPTACTSLPRAFRSSIAATSRSHPARPAARMVSRKVNRRPLWPRIALRRRHTQGEHVAPLPLPPAPHLATCHRSPETPRTPLQTEPIPCSWPPPTPCSAAL